MRLRQSLLTLCLSTALAVPVVLTLPVVTAPAATPHPVKPKEQHIPLHGVDAQALADARAGDAQARGMLGAAAVQDGAAGPRVAVLTGQMNVARFSLVGVAWDRSPAAGTVPSSIQVRTRALDGTWTAWSVLDPSDVSPDLGSAEYARVQPYTEPLIAPDSTASRYGRHPGRARPPACGWPW